MSIVKTLVVLSILALLAVANAQNATRPTRGPITPPTRPPNTDRPSRVRSPRGTQCGGHGACFDFRADFRSCSFSGARRRNGAPDQDARRERHRPSNQGARRCRGEADEGIADPFGPACFAHDALATSAASIPQDGREPAFLLARFAVLSQVPVVVTERPTRGQETRPPRAAATTVARAAATTAVMNAPPSRRAVGSRQPAAANSGSASKAGVPLETLLGASSANSAAKAAAAAQTRAGAPAAARTQAAAADAGKSGSGSGKPAYAGKSGSGSGQPAGAGKSGSGSTVERTLAAPATRPAQAATSAMAARASGSGSSNGSGSSRGSGSGRT